MTYKELISLIIIIAIVLLTIVTGIKKIERIECNKWKEQATQYADFYLTEWQVEQCLNYNIEL
jgi:hypothetical protein